MDPESDGEYVCVESSIRGFNQEPAYVNCGLSNKEGLQNYPVNVAKQNPDPLMSYTEVKRNDPYFTEYQETNCCANNNNNKAKTGWFTLPNCHHMIHQRISESNS